jgi:hypothetical protein
MSFLSMASRILTRYKALPTRIWKKFGVISRMVRYTEGAYMGIGALDNSTLEAVDTSSIGLTFTHSVNRLASLLFCSDIVI